MPRNCSAASFSTFLQRIEQASAAGRFHKKPIGPIGAHLSLQDEKWALAVEVAIGRAFNTFVVHDFADQATLKVCIAGQLEPNADTGHPNGARSSVNQYQAHVFLALALLQQEYNAGYAVLV